ncbi:unnamed protein product [Prunus armeniaca]
MAFRDRVSLEWCDGRCCEPFWRSGLLHLVDEGQKVHLINFPAQGLLYTSFKLETLKSVIHKPLDIFCSQGLWLSLAPSMIQEPLVNFLINSQGFISLAILPVRGAGGLSL